MILIFSCYQTTLKKNYIRILAIALCCLTLVFFGAKVASAHFFQTDGAITGVLHLEPDDNPIVGQQAYLSVGVSDAQNRFKANQCDCSISISKDGKLLSSSVAQPVGPGPSIFTYRFPFIFPEKAIYQVVFAGQPKIPNGFQNFKVSYNFRVDRENSLPTAASLSHLTHSSHLWHIVLYVIIFLAVAIKAIWEKIKI